MAGVAVATPTLPVPLQHFALLSLLATPTLTSWLTFALVGGGGHFGPPLWFFEDNSKTKGSSVTKLGIPFH